MEREKGSLSRREFLIGGAGLVCLLWRLKCSGLLEPSDSKSESKINKFKQVRKDSFQTEAGTVGFLENPPWRDGDEVMPPEETLHLEKVLNDVQLVSVEGHTFKPSYTPENINPEDYKNIHERTVRLLNLVESGGDKSLSSPFIFDEGERDWFIYIYNNSIKQVDAVARTAFYPTYERTFDTLAGYLYYIERNDNIQQAAGLMVTSGAVKTINNMIGKVEPSLFHNNVSLQLPEDKEGILTSFVCSGSAGKPLGGGKGYPGLMVIFGDFGNKDLSSEVVMHAFVNNWAHEAGHSRLQAYRADNLEAVVSWNSPRGRFFHELHSILEATMLEKTDLAWVDPEHYERVSAPPRVVAIFGLLSEKGVENPMLELFSSLATWSNQTSLDSRIIERIYPLKSREPGLKKLIQEKYEQYRDQYVEARKAFAEKSQ